MDRGGHESLIDNALPCAYNFYASKKERSKHALMDVRLRHPKDRN